MPRSGVEARLRLQRAALELYRDRGFDNTTTAQIAKYAGVTERTFFRHFADKREVLFDGEAELREILERGVEQAADGLGALDVVHAALRGTVPMLEDNRSFSVPRNEVVTRTPALHERALAKEAGLTKALADALQHRGFGSAESGLTAGVGMAAFNQATRVWLTDTSQDLYTLLDNALDVVRAVVARR